MTVINPPERKLAKRTSCVAGGKNKVDKNNCFHKKVLSKIIVQRKVKANLSSATSSKKA